MSQNVTKVLTCLIISLASLIFTCESEAQNSSYEEVEWTQLMPKDTASAF